MRKKNNENPDTIQSSNPTDPPYLQNTPLIHFHYCALTSKVLDNLSVVWLHDFLLEISKFG